MKKWVEAALLKASLPLTLLKIYSAIQQCIYKKNLSIEFRENRGKLIKIGLGEEGKAAFFCLYFVTKVVRLRSVIIPSCKRVVVKYLHSPIVSFV